MLIVVLIVALLLAIGGGVFFFVQNAQASEVTLEPSATTSVSPFLPSVEGATPVSPSAAPSAPATPRAAPAPPPNGPAGVAIYGGSGSDRVCDKEKLIAFLTTHPNEAKAWAGVEGISVAAIPDFIRDLTPETLTHDVRVTNHGFVNGRANAYQSLFQTGTAVLVNRYGYPVVRCLCGNPLLPPLAAKKVRYTGPQWPGFNPTVIIVYVAPPGNVPNVPTAAPAGGQTPPPVIGNVSGNYTMTFRQPATHYGAAQNGVSCELTGQTTFPARITQTGNQVTITITDTSSSPQQDVVMTGTIDAVGGFDIKGNFGEPTLGVSLALGYKGTVDVAGNWDGTFTEDFGDPGKPAGCNIKLTAARA